MSNSRIPRFQQVLEKKDNFVAISLTSLVASQIDGHDVT